MAEAARKTAQEQVSPVEQEQVVVVAADVPPTKPAAEKRTMPLVEEKQRPPPPVPETEEEAVESKPSGEGDDVKVPLSGSFDEESTRASDLLDSEKKAFQELKQLVRDALNKHELLLVSPPPTAAPVTKEAAQGVEGQRQASSAAVATEDEKDAVPRETLADIPAKAEPDEVTAEPNYGALNEENKVAVVEKITEVVVGEKVVAAAADNADDDGAKTVEAIEETIVAVSSSSPSAATPPREQSSIDPDAAASVAAKVVKSESSNNEVPEPPMPVPPQEVSIWGIPLLADERSDVILLKFLRARDFKVKDAFAMLKNTLRWRKEFGIEELLDQDLGDDLAKVVFMHGFDKQGHPVCYNVYGEFQNKELYHSTFSDEDKRQRFLKWRIQFLERSIRKLDFSPGGISAIVQVNDLKNSPGPAKRELRQATRQALQLLQDNYPEFLAKQVFINVPWWYLAVNRMISPFLTQRTRSKFVFASPPRSAETLLRYIAAEQIPVKYGGLSKDGQFEATDVVTEITLKPTAKHTVEFPVTETCLLTWEVRVVGWDVSYGAEFVPSAEENYTVIIRKARKVAKTEEPVVCNSFKNDEPGKVVLTIDNPTSKKKKLLYRSKTSLPLVD